MISFVLWDECADHKVLGQCFIPPLSVVVWLFVLSSFPPPSMALMAFPLVQQPCRMTLIVMWSLLEQQLGNWRCELWISQVTYICNQAFSPCWSHSVCYISHRYGRPGVELTALHPDFNKVLQILPFSSEVVKNTRSHFLTGDTCF